MKASIRLALVATLLATLAPRAQARQGSDATEMAKQYYKFGLDAYQAGRYDEAVKELKKAYLIKRMPALLLNIGATYRKMGDTANAISYYQKYLAEAPAAKDRDEVRGILAQLKAGSAEEPSPPAQAAAPAEPPARAAVSAPVYHGPAVPQAVDNEQAPLTVSVAEHQWRMRHREKGPSASPVARVGTAFWIGSALAVVGIAGVATGGWSLYQAKNYADVLSADSRARDANGNPYPYHDPSANPYDDHTVEQRGHTYNVMGVALAVAGGAALITGAALVAADQTVLKRKRERPWRSAWVAPALGRNMAGLALGATF